MQQRVLLLLRGVCMNCERAKMFPGMKKRLRFRKFNTAIMSVEMRNRFILAMTCLAVISLVHYCRYTNYSSEEVENFSLPNLARGVNPQTLQSQQVPNLLSFGGSLGRLRRTQGDGAAHCKDRYVYMHRVPREWNAEILSDCHLLKEWTDMCAALSNAGLGPSMHGDTNYFTPTGWYETHQFALEVIFHNRMKQYECLTTDSSQASAIYVPFYAGLEAQRTLWNVDFALRDLNPLKFEQWLVAQPEWEAHGGHDHFTVGGRITWDFRRTERSRWGNILLTLPAMQNMTTLVIESSPWDPIDVGIPYPTNFHPSSDSELRDWQAKVRAMNRPVLFSFAGGTRRDMSRLIRGQLIDQCRRSPYCKVLSCDGGACQSPQPLMKLFEESQFCLQPQGDSATRKSIFDSMLAGCIPVFFHQHSYSGYEWHLPKNQSEYSVFIAEEHIRSGVLSVESVLRRIPATTIKRMRETIVELIPNFVYADPRGVSMLEESTDAFGIAMEGVLERISVQKRNLQQQK